VAVSSAGQIDTSTNGTQWTAAWHHSNYDFTSLAYGNGHFVAADSALGAVAISTNGIDWSRLFPLLTVRNSKYGKSREVLLHPSTVQALRHYVGERDQLIRPVDQSVFVSTRGTRINYSTVRQTFGALRSRTFVGEASCRPRIHDLRHTFAVNTLLSWYRDGGEIASRTPLLSTYLGHANPASTYWYLSAMPELLSLAAQRQEQAFTLTLEGRS
jgi:integrase